MIHPDKMISVPAQVLQDLIHNAELACAGMGRGEHAVNRQCRTLQTCLDLDGQDAPNVTVVNFRR
jgi:hypothetical protein